MGMKLDRRGFLTTAGALCLVPFIPARADSDVPALSGPTMGTRYTVRISSPPRGVSLPKLRYQIERVLESTDSLMSTYRPESEISRLNRDAGTGWVDVSEHTARVLGSALRIQQLSEGAFNPGLGNLVSQWGFGPVSSLLAASAAVSPASSHSNPGDQEFKLSGQRIMKSGFGIALDLNGIAKGDAVDRVVRLLEETGIGDYLVEIGGEVRARGKGPGGDGWKVGVQGPVGDVVAVLGVDDMAVATSGDHVHYYEVGGRRISHLMDPRSGKPVEDPLSLVCVARESAMEADAWSTALMVMGLEKGRAFAREFDMAALFVYRKPDDNSGNYATPAFERIALKSSGNRPWQRS